MQSDLFQFPSASPFQMPKNSFVERYRLNLRLDQAALLAIVLVVFYTFVYSSGVEKGKKAAAHDFDLVAAKLQEQIFSKENAKAAIAIDAAQIPAVQLSTAESPEAASAAESKPRAELAVEPKAVISEAAADVKKEPAAKLLDGKYTIQLVTYRDSSEAERQLKVLSDKGHQGFVIPSGSYHQVCVNAFESMSRASSFLKTLKMDGIAPKDAYVRNIPR